MAATKFDLLTNNFILVRVFTFPTVRLVLRLTATVSAETATQCATHVESSLLSSCVNYKTLRLAEV